MENKSGGILKLLLGTAEAYKAAQNMQLLLSNSEPQVLKDAQCAVHLPTLETAPLLCIMYITGAKLRMLPSNSF
jgi:hypothetical protein